MRVAVLALLVALLAGCGGPEGPTTSAAVPGANPRLGRQAIEACGEDAAERQPGSTAARRTSCSTVIGMAALFPRWANGLARGAIAAVAVAVAGVPAGLMAWVRTPFHRGQFYPTPQPVAFAHTLHAGEDAIDCRYCHHTVERTPYAAIPSTEVCLGCHRQILSASPLLAPVRWSAESGEPIPWRRVHNLPDHVYFDHAAHLNAGVGCVTCHGRVDLMPVVVQVAPLSMGWCLECHRRPERYLRPREQVTSMTWTPDRPQLELGLALKAEYGVRDLVTCTTCHR